MGAEYRCASGSIKALYTSAHRLAKPGIDALKLHIRKLIRFDPEHLHHPGFSVDRGTASKISSRWHLAILRIYRRIRFSVSLPPLAGPSADRTCGVTPAPLDRMPRLHQRAPDHAIDVDP